MNLKFSAISDITRLHDFDCGIEEMNRFLKGPFQDSIENHYCRSFVVTSQENTDEVLAVFALSFDSLDLDTDDKDDLLAGFSSTPIPNITEEYQDIFWSKRRYPALDITYLAVNVRHQRKNIGRIIIDMIANIATSQQIAGCQFLTVEALKTEGKSAVPFYLKCDFTPNEQPNPNKETLRMFRTLYVAE